MVNLKRFAASILATLIVGQMTGTPTALAALTGTLVSMILDQTTTNFDPSVNQQATIKYRVIGPDPAQLTLKIFKRAADGNRICKETDNTLLVANLENGSKPVGENTSTWTGKKPDGTNEAPGTYCFVLRWTNPLVNSTNPTVTVPALDKAFHEGIIIVNNPGTTPPPVTPPVVNPATAITIDSSSTNTIDLSAASPRAEIKYKINTDLPNGYAAQVYDSSNWLVANIYSTQQRVSTTAPPGTLLQLLWYGTYDDGVSSVLPGTYTFRFKVGGLNSASLPIRVTRSTPIPPQDQFTVYANPSTFNPAISGTTIYYNVNRRAANGLAVAIRDSSNSTVAQLFSTNRSVEVGSYSVPWNGILNTGSTTVRYKYVLIADGQEISGDVWVLSSSTTPPPPPPAATFIASNSLNKPSFTPANGEKVVITYTLGKAIYNFKLTIKDPTGTLSYTLDSASYKAAGTYTSPEWNGIISQTSSPAAAFAANAGTYNYVFEAANETTVIGASAITLLAPVQQTAPVITDLVPVPATFNPDTVPAGGVGTTFTYLLTQDARVDFKILNGNVIIRQLRSDDHVNNNGFANIVNTVTWDGRGENSSTIANGTYTYSISAVNQNGVAQTKTGFITVDRGTVLPGTQIDVRNVSADPATFNPYTQSQMNIRFTLNREAYVRVTITRASDGAVIKTLPSSNQYNQYYTAGSNFVTWSGTDLNNYLVTLDGTYYARVEASSVSGASVNADTETATFTINRNLGSQLQVTSTGASPVTLDPSKNESTRIDFNVNMAPSTVNVKIYRASDNYNAVRELPVLTLSGYYAYTAQWDGHDNYGRIVSDDTYTYKIEVTNSTNVAYASGTIYVKSSGDSAAPYIGNCGSYTDIKSNHYLCPALEFVKSHNIFAGYSDGSIRLNRVITRAELLAVIQKAFKYNLESYSKSIDGDLGFKDLARKKNAWYMPYIKTFLDMGLIAGYPDKTMKPERTMATAELYLVFLKAALAAPKDVANFYIDDTVTRKPFIDTPLTKATRWYIRYAAFAALNDLVVTERFYPDRGITRGQVIQLIYDTHKKGLISY